MSIKKGVKLKSAEYIGEEKRAGKCSCWRMLMMPFKVICGEPKLHRVTLRGVHDRIRQRWYQKWTPVMSQLPAVLAVSHFCGWTFKCRLTVKRWWMRLQSVWVTSHERLHHHSLDNNSLPLSSNKKRKKRKEKKAKGMCGWCSILTSKCKAGCVQVGGWAVALSVVSVPVTVNCWIKCAVLRNKVFCFGSALAL